MDNNELIAILNTGLDQNRITEEEYNHAFHLYTLIYENHTASECGDEHASLASLINKAANVDEETLKLRMAEEYESAMTSADLQYIRKQEEKARAQITGDEGKTARRKLMRR